MVFAIGSVNEMWTGGPPLPHPEDRADGTLAAEGGPCGARASSAWRGVSALPGLLNRFMRPRVYSQVFAGLGPASREETKTPPAGLPARSASPEGSARAGKFFFCAFFLMENCEPADRAAAAFGFVFRIKKIQLGCGRGGAPSCIFIGVTGGKI